VRPNGYTKVGLVENAATAAYATFDCTGSGSVLATGAGGSGSITNVGDGWYRLTLTLTTQVAQTTYRLDAFVLSPGYTTGTVGTSWIPDGVSGVYLWGADLRVTNDGVGIPAYQRVAAATDYDTSGFPLYLKFDGTDDSLATASIDFSATDKMSVFAGVRKLSDGTLMIAELGASGPFSLYNYSAGPVYQWPGAASGVITAPISSVLTGTINTAITSSILRVNGSQVGNGNPGFTGNFTNNPLYIGRRGGSSLPYNGRLYSLIVRGAQSTDAQIASAETWVNGKTGAY
jgi:hypothetical protein